MLAATAATDGTWLLGTRDALVIVPSGETSVDATEPGPPAGPTRIPWQDVERADWDAEADRLEVSEVGEYGLIRGRYSFPVTEPGVLLQLVRERVTASIVLERRVRVQGQKGLVVVARRAPSGDGDITWAYQFDAGIDPADPAVMALAEAALREAQGELGA